MPTKHAVTPQIHLHPKLQRNANNTPVGLEHAETQSSMTVETHITVFPLFGLTLAVLGRSVLVQLAL
jgi:hypothetical protein